MPVVLKVSDDIVIALIDERLRDPSTRAGAIFDGFPRTVAQAEALDKMLASHGRRIGRAVLVHVSDAEVERRNVGRRTCSKCQRSFHIEFAPPAKPGICDACGGELVQRADDQAEKVRARLQAYHRDTEPVIGYYQGKQLLQRVDGAGTQGAVFDALVRQIDGGVA